MRRPRQFFRSSLRSLAASRPVARRLLLRNLRAQHRVTALGYIWILIPSLATTLLWAFLNASNIINTGPTQIPYVAFVIIGVVLWQGFVDGITAPLRSLGSATNMLTRVKFPAESILLAGLGEVALGATVRFFLIVPILVIYRISPTWTVVFSPLAAVAMLLAGFAVGLTLAPFGMLYQDVGRAIPVVLQFLFLMTPIAYAVPKEGLATLLERVNPLAPLLSQGRQWLTGGGAIPSLGFVVVTVGILAVLAGGWVLFRLSIPHLVDRVSS